MMKYMKGYGSGLALGIVLVCMAVVFAFAATAAVTKPVGSDLYNGTGFTPNVMHEVPVSQSEIDGFNIMGIGCMHNIKGVSVFAPSNDEYIGDVEVLGTECVPFASVPLLPLIMDSVPSELVKQDGMIGGFDLASIDNPLAECFIEGYYYTAFLPVLAGPELEDIVGVKEKLVGVMITSKSCTELVEI